MLYRHGPFAGQRVDVEEGPYLDSLLATGYAVELRVPEPVPVEEPVPETAAGAVVPKPTPRKVVPAPVKKAAPTAKKRRR
jgi:hypothetical protein